MSLQNLILNGTSSTSSPQVHETAMLLLLPVGKRRDRGGQQ
jgi:hypothetical protein